jgi:hypothetical protein
MVLYRILLGAGIAFVVLCAAIAGLTYGMVMLSKDTQISNGSVLSTKDGGAPIATGRSDSSSTHMLHVGVIQRISYPETRHRSTGSWATRCRHDGFIRA